MKPEQRFKVGDRVRISLDDHWAQGALATISLPPDAVNEGLSAPPNKPYQGNYRLTEALSRTVTLYWLVFDEPHDDGSGDGPYFEAEIYDQFLSPA